MEKNPYQVCATCIHFEAKKTNEGMKYRCKRLGYETKPTHSFHCWNPKPHVIQLMNK